MSIPRLTLSVPDQQFMAELLGGGDPEAKRRSHELLKDAFTEIGQHLWRIIDEATTDDAKARALDVVHEVVAQDWTVIHMAAGAKSDAYMLFQVLNDRGVSLTEGELLRASTLEALEAQLSAARMTSVEAAWDEILSGIDADIRDALAWIYASHVGAWPAKPTFLADFHAGFFLMPSPGRPLTSEEAAALQERIEVLHNEFGRLWIILQGEWPCDSHQAVGAWDRDRLRLLVVHLKQRDCIPLLIAATLLPPPKFAEVVNALERFCFRYFVMVEASPSAAVDVFHKFAAEIRKNPTAFDTRALIAELGDLLANQAPNDVFASRLKSFGYPRSESAKPLKYFLMTIEHYLRWYPEAPDPQLDVLLDTLGNLTILSPSENDAAGAKRFSDKKKYLSESATLLNKQIAAEPQWTAAVVEKRHARLIDIALRIFAL